MCTWEKREAETMCGAVLLCAVSFFHSFPSFSPDLVFLCPVFFVHNPRLGRFIYHVFFSFLVFVD